MRYGFRIVNVFTVDNDRLSGNPLCVFEDARGLSDAQMQALARQLNLSETTFILPSQQATARVRIFTPGFEMPFAGHPTLGEAPEARSPHGSRSALRGAQQSRRRWWPKATARREPSAPHMSCARCAAATAWCSR
jgi:PhzF family phenazine biosynthesis protein